MNKKLPKWIALTYWAIVIVTLVGMLPAFYHKIFGSNDFSVSDLQIVAESSQFFVMANRIAIVSITIFALIKQQLSDIFIAGLALLILNVITSVLLISYGPLNINLIISIVLTFTSALCLIKVKQLINA